MINEVLEAKSSVAIESPSLAGQVEQCGNRSNAQKRLHGVFIIQPLFGQSSPTLRAISAASAIAACLPAMALSSVPGNKREWFMI